MLPFETFDEFWPFYLREHSDPTTRALHIVGTSIAGLSLLGWLASRKKSYLLLALAGSYGPAWLGHYAVERNRPATFDHPLWSLRADLRMYEMWMAGTLDAELSRLGIQPRAYREAQTA